MGRGQVAARRDAAAPPRPPGLASGRLALAVYGIFAVTASLAGGILADRHDPRRVATAGFAWLPVACAALAAAGGACQSACRGT